MKLTIGLSYAPASNPKYQNYRNALTKAAQALEYEIEVVDLTSDPGRAAEMDGIVFTGGADIQPARYGKQAEERLCTEIDEERDQKEFEIAEIAERESTPVLGICRGLQLLNVHRGGTLITDLETFGGAMHKKVEGNDTRHTVKVEPGSYLKRILREATGEINSAHHQAVERIGEGLVASARAEQDGTIEALEWADATGRPFFLAVQWHPERMDFEERFAGRLFETFVWEAAANKILKERIGSLRAAREENEASPQTNEHAAQ
jgi:putative glutamine amidotransferase